MVTPLWKNKWWKHENNEAANIYVEMKRLRSSMVWVWLNRPDSRLPSAKRIWIVVTGAPVLTFRSSLALFFFFFQKKKKYVRLSYRYRLYSNFISGTYNFSLSSLQAELVDGGTAAEVVDSLTLGVGLEKELCQMIYSIELNFSLEIMTLYKINKNDKAGRTFRLDIFNSFTFPKCGLYQQTA